MTARCNHGLLIFSFALILGGCSSLPGFDRPEYVESSSGWFDKSDAQEEELQDYEPEVHRITPSLIRELHSIQVAAPTDLPKG